MEAPDELTQRFKNRIVRYGEDDPEQLLAHPLNYRVHPRNQGLALHGILDEVGWVQNVIVNERTGCVVDGHLRVALAISEGETRVPVTYVDLSPEEEAKILASFDPVTTMALPDREKLDELLAGIRTQSAGLGSLLASLTAQPLNLPRLGAPLPGQEDASTLNVGAGGSLRAPHDSTQDEPRLEAEMLIEVRCSRAFYQSVERVILAWQETPGVDISIV